MAPFPHITAMPAAAATGAGPRDANRDAGNAALAEREIGHLYRFLLGFRVERGCEHTHTSFARPSGAFYVPTSAHDEFLRLYAAAMAAGEALHLTERHRPVGPAVLDLDFRFEPDAEELSGAREPRRRYRAADVAAAAEVFARSLAAYADVPRVEVYVLEKPPGAVALCKGAVKDGLHFVAPGVVTRPGVQLLARREALGEYARALAGLGLANEVEDVVDEAVLERNNWMMYGSSKPGAPAYALTAVYALDCAASAFGRVPGAGPDAHDPALVDLLSIRNKYDESPLREDRRGEVEAYLAEQEDRRRRREAARAVLGTQENARQNTCADGVRDEVARLVDCLDPGRADRYPDWIRVGWCLRNIDHRLLETWVGFSKRSDKYVDGECPRLWQYMRAGGLGIGTLHMWARQDSPERYRELVRGSLARLIEAAASGTHYDVARVVHHLYRYEYVCASIRTRTWYEFRDHRWRASDSACSLRKRVSTDVFDEILKVSTALQQRAAPLGADSADGQKQLETAKKLTAVASKLKCTAYKDNVIRECSELFYQERFEELLDSDLNLIGFENGVYDLERHEFREGRPDDRLSFSTGTNYVEYRDAEPVVQEIKRFWEQVHPDPAIRDYVLRTLAACLSGHTQHERFNIWTGVGSNGKSLSVELFERSFGDYCCKFPVTLLTQRRAASNAATSEVARSKGKRFGVLQEPSEDEKLNIGLMKELTGGDKIIARQLYREPVEFKPQFKLFLLCNHLPHVPSDDGGTWRRIRVVEFTSRFVERPCPERPNEFPIDPDLSRKLDGWREHFMAMLIDMHRRHSAGAGARHLAAREPEAVMRCTRDYQRNNDHMADFVDSCLERMTPDSSATVALDDVYAEFREWLRRDSIPIRTPKKKDLQAYLDRNVTRSAQLGGRACYRGLRLRDAYASAPALSPPDDPL